MESGIKGFLDAYTTADFSLGVSNDTYRVEVFATNLFNSNGVVNTGVQCVETTCGDPGGVSGTGPVYYDTVIRPRIVGLKVGMDF